MKKISKILGLCVALVMVLGSTMTVFAANSVATASATATDASAVAVEAADGTALTVAAVTETKVADAQKAAASFVGTDSSVLVEKVFEINGTISAPTDITISVPGITAGQKVAVLHQKADGTWESLPVTSVAAGSVTATFTSLSPVAVVTYGTSPKTGVVFPVVGVLCIIALFGAALCYKKYAK